MFINDIMVETEGEEEHDELVEEVIRRLAGNNLYVKLEKCKWKVSVVATTRHSRTNDLTTSKALSRAIK